MRVVIKEVNSKRDLKTFVYLPAKIHRDHENWVPPIYMDEISFFNPKKNRSFSYCDHIRLLAYNDDKPVGRIMGLINHRYNERKGVNDSRFSYFETYDDPEVAHALISAIEDWGRCKKTDRLVGPLGFSDKEPTGMMVEGFDKPIVLASNGNHEYQVKLLENEGYTTEVEMVCYRAVIPDKTPKVYEKVLPRIESRIQKEFKIIEFRTKLSLRKYIYPVLHLTNRTFDHLYGSIPYEKHEMKEFANRFIWLLNPRFVKVIENQQKEVVAYMVGIPDLGEGIIKSKGKMIPFGIFKLLRAAKKTDRIVMLLGAIDFPYRGRGLDVFMGLKLFESARHEGKKFLDSHLVLSTNLPMRAECERIGGEIYKRYRIYVKNL